jgi:hypothetical protein
MRVLKNIPHPQCQITVFEWSGNYLLKLEQGPLEQTFKVRALDVTGPDDMEELLKDEAFMQAAFKRFDEMRDSFYEAMAKL